MPIKPVDRHLFLQGGRCFFCNDLVARSDASLEHLKPRSQGGENDDENCVACCKALNSLFGRMSLKEKIRVVLNQDGKFDCPNKLTSTCSSYASCESASTPANEAHPTKSKPAANQWIITDLQKRGTSRPKTVKALRSTIRAIAPAAVGMLSEEELDTLLEDLQRRGKIQISETKVQYTL